MKNCDGKEEKKKTTHRCSEFCCDFIVHRHCPTLLPLHSPFAYRYPGSNGSAALLTPLHSFGVCHCQEMENPFWHIVKTEPNGSTSATNTLPFLYVSYSSSPLSRSLYGTDENRNEFKKRDTSLRKNTEFGEELSGSSVILVPSYAQLSTSQDGFDCPRGGGVCQWCNKNNIIKFPLPVVPTYREL